MTEVSATRLYLGNLPRNATKAEVEAHFQTHGTGEITEVKLMNGFGFIVTWFLVSPYCPPSG
jgi:transcription initiation factor TFIID subunit 15